MTYWQSLKSFIATNPELINLVSIALGVAGVILALYFYKRSIPIRQLSYACRTFRIISDKCQRVPELGVTYEGKNIPSLSVTKLAVWNAGTEALRAQDIPSSDPLVIATRGNKAQLLKVMFIEATHPANAAAVQIFVREGNELAKLTFEYLNPGDALLVDVVHTGTGIDDIELRGSLVGARIRKTTSDPETLTTSADSHGATTLVSVESGRAHEKFFGYAFLTMSACAAIASGVGAYFDFKGWRALPVFSVAFFALGLLVLAHVTRTYPPSKIREFDSDI